MKKIEFRTKDDYQYTITGMTKNEVMAARLIFLKQGVKCKFMLPYCHCCPLDELCYTKKGMTKPFYGGKCSNIIKSSIKITY